MVSRPIVKKAAKPVKSPFTKPKPAAKARPARSESDNEFAAIVAEIRGLLKIDKFDLDNEAAIQPELYFRVAEAQRRASFVAFRAKEDLVAVRASVYRKVRAELAKDESVKVTESLIENGIVTDPEMKAAQRDRQKAEADADMLMSLKDSMQQKSYMIRELVELYMAQYFNTDEGVKSRRHSSNARN